jgi:hypothetical protein
MTTTIESELVSQFKAARRVSTPLVFIKTPDPAATQLLLCEQIHGRKATPKIAWDAVQGLHAANEHGDAVLRALAGDEADDSDINTADLHLVQSTKGNLISALVISRQFPERSMLFVHNAQDYVSTESRDYDVIAVQAVWNLRDQFKQNRRTLVMLGPDVKMPPQLQGSLLELDEPLPTDEQLQDVVREQLSAAADQIEFEITDKLIVDTASHLKGLPT